MSKDWNNTQYCNVIKSKITPEIWDTIVIGGGPAGISSSLYAARKGLKTLMLTGNKGGQLALSMDIQNYPGTLKSTGISLTEQLYDDISFHLDIVKDAFCSKIEVYNDIYKVYYNDTYALSKTIIIATGKSPRRLNIPNEERARASKTLSFSTTSDAPLYAHKHVAIIGGGNSAFDSALQLIRFGCTIELFTNIDRLIGEQCMIDSILKNSNIKVHYNMKITEVMLDNDDKVIGIKGIDKDAKEAIYPCQGVFEQIGWTANTDLVKDILMLNNASEVVVDNVCNTSMKGIFACGDCTNIAYKQVLVASGHGAIAALEAHKYISK